jgi:thioredoxin-related protein
MAKHVLVAVLLIAAVFCHAAASEEEGKDVIKLINDKAKPTEDFETQVRSSAPCIPVCLLSYRDPSYRDP